MLVARVLSAAWLGLTALGCDAQFDRMHRGRSDAVARESQEMSGPNLLSRERLTPALAALRAKAGGKLLRLEIRPSELIMQVEDPTASGSVVELHYRDDRVGEAEPVTLRGKGKLKDNLFNLSDVKLDTLPELSREAVRRIDAENGRVDLVLVRRNLPHSEDVKLRLYVASPRQSGHLDADHTGQPL